jgi:hypothetical protein
MDVNVKQLFSRVIAPTDSSTPAADAYAKHNREVAARGAEAEALTRKIQELGKPIEDGAADVRELDRLQTERQSLRADLLTGDGTDADLAAVDAKISSIRDRRTKRGDGPEIAELARTRTQAKLDGIQSEMLALQKRAPRLFQDVLLERMAQRATAFNETLDAFMSAYIDLGAMAHAHDLLCPLAPGSTGIGSGHLFEIAIPLPQHRAYSQTADHNLRGQIEARAAALLADVPRIR